MTNTLHFATELSLPCLLGLLVIGSVVVAIYSISGLEWLWWLGAVVMFVCWLRCSVDKFLHDDLCYTLIVEGD